MSFTHIMTEVDDKVAIIKLNRPKAMNALCADLISEVSEALDEFESNANIHVVILTGNEKAFAAGADIKEMADKSFIDTYTNDFIAPWECIAKFRKPIIAAVSGYALGGGCEIAMMCDFIVASDTARFGQPEITIGTIPGAGGTQRLTRFIGKSKAMDMCLTGRMMDAEEAERSGLVSRIFPTEDLLEETKKIAQRIANMSSPMSCMVKETVNKAYETTMAEGIRFERRVFHSTFATEDRKEGMKAFLEKRVPSFLNK